MKATDLRRSRGWLGSWHVASGIRQPRPPFGSIIYVDTSGMCQVTRTTANQILAQDSDALSRAAKILPFFSLTAYIADERRAISSHLLAVRYMTRADQRDGPFVRCTCNDACVGERCSTAAGSACTSTLPYPGSLDVRPLRTLQMRSRFRSPAGI